MDTSLRTLVLSGKLKQPIQKGFSREAWDAALRAINRPSDEDREIHRAALFFASQLDGLRLVLDQNPAAPGSPESRVRRAIGFINRDHKVLEQALESSRSSVRPTGNAVPLTEILQFEVDLSSGNRIGPQQLIESAVDGLRFELAKQNDGRTSQNSVGDHALAIRRTYLRLNLSVFYHLLEEEWRESLYSGLRVVDTENGLTTLRPTDTHAAEAQAIGMYRSTAIDLEFATHAASMFRGSKASAIEGIRGIVQRGSGRNARYQVSELKSESAAAVLVPRALAIEPDLAPFMSEPLEGFSMLTPTELLSAWSAVATLGRHIGGRLELVDIHSVQDFERLAPIVKLRDLLPAIARCTELPRENVRLRSRR